MSARRRSRHSVTAASQAGIAPSAAGVIGWEFRHRHRWGLRALLVYIAALAFAKLMVVTRGIAIRLDSPESFALAR